MTRAAYWTERYRGALLIGFLPAVTLVGCAQQTPAVSTSASATLGADVQRIHAAAASDNTTQVASAADQLRADLAIQRAAGHISSARASAVLDQLARVLADIAAIAPLATPTASPAEDGHHGKGKGQDEGTDNSDGG